MPDKNSEMLMDRQTEGSDFSGPSVGHGSKKVISGTEECHSVWERKKNRKLNPFMKLWYIGQIYTILK